MLCSAFCSPLKRMSDRTSCKIDPKMAQYSQSTVRRQELQKKNATKSSIVNQSKTTLIHIVFSCTYSCCILMHIFILYSHAHTSTTDDSSECGRANHQLATTVGRQQWRRPLRKRDKQHEYSYELMQDRKDLFTCTSAQTNMAPNTLHETRKVIVFLKMIFFQLARKRKKTTCPNPCIARWSDVSMTLFTK